MSLSKIDTKEIERSVTRIYTLRSKNGWAISFPIALDEKFFVISEAIRTEGCIMKSGKFSETPQGIAISNKDLSILHTFERALYDKGIVDKSISRILHVHCYIPSENQIEYIIDKYGRKLHFKQNLDRTIFVDYIDKYPITKSYRIKFKNGDLKSLSVAADSELVLRTISKINSACFLSLQVYNSTFAIFLNRIFDIKFGIGREKTYNIDFPFDLDCLNKNILASILNVVTCCEGSIMNREGTRAVNIKITSLKYLNSLKRMFNYFGIECKIAKVEKNLFNLAIGRRKNLAKFGKLVAFVSIRKNRKMRELLSSYVPNRFAHHEATLGYLCMLKKYGPLDLLNLSKLTKKDYNTLISTFYRLDKLGLISKYGRTYNGFGSTPWVYKLSTKGETLLRNTQNY